MQIKENIKVPRHWPLCGEFTGTCEFPAQKASYAEKVSILWRHHGYSKLLILAVTVKVVHPKYRSYMIQRGQWFDAISEKNVLLMSVSRGVWIYNRFETWQATPQQSWPNASQLPKRLSTPNTNHSFLRLDLVISKKYCLILILKRTSALWQSLSITEMASKDVTYHIYRFAMVKFKDLW